MLPELLLDGKEKVPTCFDQVTPYENNRKPCMIGAGRRKHVENHSLGQPIISLLSYVAKVYTAHVCT